MYLTDVKEPDTSHVIGVFVFVCHCSVSPRVGVNIHTHSISTPQTSSKWYVFNTVDCRTPQDM